MNDMLAAQFERTVRALTDCADEAESGGEFELAGDLRFCADMLTDQHPKEP